MKKPAFLFLYIILHAFHSSAQSGWVTYNINNSPLLDNRVSSIALDHDNNLWGAYAGAGGYGNGVVKFDGFTFKHYNTENSGLPNNDIRDITIDPHGNVWFACYNAGIVKFDGTNWTRYHEQNSGIVGNNVSDIEFDSNGVLWVGAYFNGVSRFDGVSWTTFTKNNAPFAGSNCISDLAIDNANNVWVGMDCAGGMAKFSSSSGIWTGYSTLNSSIPDHTVTTLLADAGGRIWASHINVDVSSFNGSNWTTYTATSPKAIDKFMLDQQGNLWGGGFGLFKFENGAWTNVAIPLAADTTAAFGLAEDKVGNFWLSTYAGLWLKAINTSPAFDVEAVVVDENFETFKVPVVPARVRLYEQSQTVTYSLINNDEQKVNATINALTGEITVSSVADEFGTASLKIIANDGQASNNIYEAVLTVTINPVNTPPIFDVGDIVVDEDFETFKVSIAPAPVRAHEQGQTVAYSLVNLDEQKITAAINPLTGEITLTSVADAFGTASLKIIANDGQALNNIHEVVMTITINAVEEPNTPPVFEVADIVLDEDFEMLKVSVTPADVPENEKWQTVSYSLINLDEQKITATINPQTGEITLTSVVDAFGTASLKVKADDGQAFNNVHEVTVTVTINSVEDVVTSLDQRAEEEIIFFPNPVSTTLSWTKTSLATPSVLVMIDMMGREVRRCSMSANNSSVQLSDLPPGVYLVRVVWDHQVSKLYKIIKG